MDLIKGYIRNNYDGHVLSQEIITAITYYHGVKFDASIYVQVQSGGIDPANYLAPRINISLSKTLTSFADSCPIVQCSQVPPDTLGHIDIFSHHVRD